MWEGTRFPLQDPLLQKAPAVCPSKISSGQVQGHICIWMACIQGLMNMQIQSLALSPQLGTVACRIPQSIPGGLCPLPAPHQGHSCTLILLLGEQPTPAHLPPLVKKIKIEKGIYLGHSLRKLKAGSIHLVLSSSTPVPRFPEQKPEVFRG